METGGRRRCYEGSFLFRFGFGLGGEPLVYVNALQPAEHDRNWFLTQLSPNPNPDVTLDHTETGLIRRSRAA